MILSNENVIRCQKGLRGSEDTVVVCKDLRTGNYVTTSIVPLKDTNFGFDEKSLKPSYAQYVEALKARIEQFEASEEFRKMRDGKK